VTKDDLLAAVVAAVGDVTRTSTKAYTDGLVSVLVHVDDLLDASEVRTLAREVGRSCATFPEVTVR
jgi:hypothetical protein